MITKYGTYKVFKCKHCNNTVEIPLHLKDTPQLEKYASFCTHDWEEQDEDIVHAEINTEESGSLQSSQTGS